MSEEPLVSANRAVSHSDQVDSEARRPVEAARPSAREASVGRHRFFWSTWYFVNALLLVSIFAAVYATVWEYSTRRYLKGFSDAIIPAAASPEKKIQAILNWMAHGPARPRSGFVGSAQDRDPTDTLNYDSLLRVCGTATNAFINLADSGGLPARRILLLNSDQGAKHVDEAGKLAAISTRTDRSLRKFSSWLHNPSEHAEAGEGRFPHLQWLGWRPLPENRRNKDVGIED
jgi:hypothetical protein